jgi:hypothetical protein
MVVYRVSFVGTRLTDAEKAALTAAGAAWEGTECGAEGPCRHRALVNATTEQEAIAAVRTVLETDGSLSDYAAAPVRDSRGEVWRGLFYRSWHEIDWGIPERAGFTEVEREVLWALADDHEPVWTIVRDPDVHANRVEIEAALAQLERKALIDKRIAASGEPGHETEPVPWWAITDEGWDLLGFIKSPRYR